MNSINKVGKNTVPDLPTVTAEAAIWDCLIHNGAGKGYRKDTIARLVGHLLRRHVDACLALELAHTFNEARCR